MSTTDGLAAIQKGAALMPAIPNPVPFEVSHGNSVAAQVKLCVHAAVKIPALHTVQKVAYHALSGGMSQGCLIS